MQPDVQHDFDWGRGHIPAIKMLLGLHLISEADPVEDKKHATDLIVLTLNTVRVAARVRRDVYARRYGDEFTIRSHRDTGATTELAKILDGWGDYFVYGFGDGSRLTAWLLGDLRVFRHYCESHQAKTGTLPGCEIPNGDGTYFRAFRIEDIPEGFIVARKPHHALALAA